LYVILTLYLATVLHGCIQHPYDMMMMMVMTMMMMMMMMMNTQKKEKKRLQ